MTDLLYELEAVGGLGTHPSIGWLSLRRLLALLEQRRLRLEDGTLIALGVHRPDTPRFRLAQPDRADPQWPFLGWDVVGDLNAHGAICDYGFSIDDIDYRGEIAHLIPDLNDLHLFQTECAAAEFLGWRTRMTPWEGPYRLVGIWEIPPDWARRYVT